MFGALSLVARGRVVEIGGTRLALPRPAGLLLEKLVTDRTGEKGERDLLVALGILAHSTPADLDELEALYRRLRPELRHAVRSNLTILSLLAPRSGMPDPQPRRARGGRAAPPPDTADPEARDLRPRSAPARARARECSRAPSSTASVRHARGVWFRLRRVLALAQGGLRSSRATEAERLIAEGHPADPVGGSSCRRGSSSSSPRSGSRGSREPGPAAVRLSADVLGAEALALVPFPVRPSSD